MSEYIFEIGQLFENTYPTEAAAWCNSNSAYIEELKSTDGVRRFKIFRVPSLTQEELSKRKLLQAKIVRSKAVESIIVTVDGMLFDGNEVAQERMARTITAAIATGEGMSATTTWVLHDNTVATVTIRQLATALRLAGEEQTRLWTVPYEASYTPSEAA